MNKKFLSAILFGALVATTTSTFVSCKDYDDDIENLQGQIDGLKSSLTSEVSTLRSELAAAKTELSADLADAQAALEAKIEDGAAGNAAALEEEVTSLKSKISSIETKLAAIATLQGEIDALEAELTATSAANTAALNAIKTSLNEFKAEVEGLFKKTLNSLVLNPQLYYGGIEAVQVSAIEYKALTLKNVSPNADNSKDAPVEATTKTQMTPLLAATYHMNPSTADLSGLTKANFKFLVEDKVSRAAGLTYEIVDFKTDKGDLTVSAKFTNGAFAEGDKVTTLALEVALEEGKTVTSDYAAVYAEKVTGFVLDNENTNPKGSVSCDPLYKKAEDAIANAPIAKVAWNSTVDLADYVETHYFNDKNKCALLPEATLAGYGFSYKYELVGYIDGANKTSQSVHAALNGSVLRPQMPADGQAAAWGAEQSQATVGRMPLVRVTLVDNNSNKNVAVGYVKVEITATPGNNTIGATAAYTFAEKFTLSCREEAFGHKVAWYQIEETILKQLGISKAEFKANYTFDGKYYDKAALDAKEVTYKNNEIAAAVVVDEVEGTTTEVLKMTVAANYAYEAFLKQTSISTIVRYSKNTGVDALGNNTYDYVYVTLTWAPSPLNVKPEGTIADTDKIKQYWFAKNNAEGGSGYEEIHVNANVPGTEKLSTTNFKKNILETFVDANITISGVDAVYTDFEDKDLIKELVFATTQSTTPLTGTDGNSYAIKASADGKSLNAHKIVSGKAQVTGTEIVKLVDNTIQYVDNAVAKALLNAAGREELAKNVTATILVKEANTCKKALVKLNNNTFDVKFLRPISVAQASMDSFKDGVDVGAAGSKVALKLNFTDWRGYAFPSVGDTDYKDYYAHYGVESIKAQLDKATTNVSGTWAKLPSGMEVKYTEATTISNKDFGTVTYVNNNAEVGNFSIKVPFTITYVWGEINIVVEFQVEKTV